jgi:hypothetical protein
LKEMRIVLASFNINMAHVKTFTSKIGVPLLQLLKKTNWFLIFCAVE